MRKAALILLVTGCALAAESFHYSVSRERRLGRDEPGELQIDGSGVSYQAANGKTKIQLAFEDIREADVSDPNEIRVETYDRLRLKAGERREFRFRLRGEKHGEDLAQFLSQRLARPVVGSYAPTTPAVFSGRRASHWPFSLWARARSSQANISLETMSVSSPTDR